MQIEAIRRRLASTAKCLLAALVLLYASDRVGAQDKVTTLAGVPLISGAVDGSPALARFGDPTAIACDSSGNLYVADNANHTIRKISSDGTVSTLAGLAGANGSADGPGAAARFDSPSGIAVDRNGNIFVSDTGNHTIRKITTDGTVSTLAGFTGDSDAVDGIGSAARFNTPLGLAVDTNGIVFVADSGNHTIRRIATDGTVTTFAGIAGSFGATDGVGTNANFNNPVGLALDPNGNLFVADANNHTIRKITPDGSVSTFAGVAGEDGCVDGIGAVARFCKPAELAMDAKGNLFVADSFNHTIRKITPAGAVSTVSGVAGLDGASDGANGAARFFNPYGVALTPQGHLIVSDTYNETIRQVLVPFGLTVDRSTSGAVRITWEAVIGRQYQLQFRDAVNGSAWQNLGGLVTATFQSTSQLDAPSSVQRFYRVLLAE